MARVNKFGDLIVWQRAHKFVLEVYRVTNNFPNSEQFGLSSQIRRAVVSVTSNIVEGFDRRSNKEFKQFLVVARASLSEVQNQLLIARDLRYVNKQDFDMLASESIEIHKMINGLIKSLQTHKLVNLQTNLEN